MCSSTTGKNIANFVGKGLRGESRTVERPADLAVCRTGDVVWVKSFTHQRQKLIADNDPALVLCDSEMASRIDSPCIVTESPRLDFVRVLRNFFQPVVKSEIHPTAVIEQGAILGMNITIGPHAYIGPSVTLGDNCIIGAGVSIESEVHIGARCRIKANSSLGGQGFGFEYDEDGVPLHFPHLGKIVLEDDVWIGANTTVELATLGATLIQCGAKIDDLVQVGHNVTVMKNSLVMANTVLCGGSTVGERCWIAPNSVVKEKVNIGHDVTVGLGSVVIRDFANGQVVAGVPAKPLAKKD